MTVIELPFDTWYTLQNCDRIIADAQARIDKARTKSEELKEAAILKHIGAGTLIGFSDDCKYIIGYPMPVPTEQVAVPALDSSSEEVAA